MRTGCFGLGLASWFLATTVLAQPASPEQNEPAPEAAEPVPPPAPTETDLEPKAAPTQLSVGNGGSFQPGVLLQGWLLGTRQDGETLVGFRIRRAELSVRGQIVPDLVAYKVMIDPAKALEFESEQVAVVGQDPPPTAPGTVEVDQPQGSVSVFQDFYVTFLSEYADVSLGQFKVPLSWEGYNSSKRLLLPERALASRQYGDRRDIGVRAEKQLGEHFYYSAGVFNGTGQNRRENNNQKDVALRLEAYPYEGGMVGLVGYTSLGERDEPGTRDRIEVDARFELGAAVVQAEYLHGWDGPSGGRVEGHGAYSAVGYTFLDRIQPVARVGFLDASISDDLPAGDDDEVVHYELGVNYFIDGDNAKLQASYSLFDFEDTPLLSAAILSAQVAF